MVAEQKSNNTLTLWSALIVKRCFGLAMLTQYNQTLEKDNPSFNQYIKYHDLHTFLHIHLRNLRTAACKNRESSVNDHFSGSLIFCPETPFSELFSKTIFTSFSDSYSFGNLRKFENAVFVLFSIRQIVQNLLQEPSNGKVLKLLQLTPNLIRHINNHSYPFLP